ncbi:family 1 glycosylhydrolase, partial [Paracoccus lichenicola]
MEKELQDYVEMGVDWIRIDIHWDLVQPTANGGFNWTLVDRVFNAIAAKGIKITAILNNTPDWVNDSMSTTADQQAYGRFAAAAAARYDAIVDHWEIFNEQNKAGITPQAYTEMLKQAYTAIKAVDADDVVITGGTAPVPSTGNGMWGAVDYLQQMYAAGAKGYFDAVGYHPYTFPLMPSNNAAWNGWQIMEDG